MKGVLTDTDNEEWERPYVERVSSDEGEMYHWHVLESHPSPSLDLGKTFSPELARDYIVNEPMSESRELVVVAVTTLLPRECQNLESIPVKNLLTSATSDLNEDSHESRRPIVIVTTKKKVPSLSGKGVMKEARRKKEE